MLFLSLCDIAPCEYAYIHTGKLLFKKKKKSAHPTLFENFILLQYINYIFFWPQVMKKVIWSAPLKSIL